MKKIVFLLPCILLAACQSQRPVSPDLQAQAAVINNQLCVKINPQGDEKVRSIFIYEGNNTGGGMMKEFYPQPQVSSNDCLPAPPYTYQSGKTYTWKIDLQSAQRLEKGDYPSTRIFTARFTWKQDGVTTSLGQDSP
ncbi:hypothetical protein BTJ39_17540 [Izhakiella australiensis]|uniref:DUF7480 domain-containing protein n=1 Tax=Izhakiella australiensis TaxID=1926881 RepID=A0A1S8YIE2_9GAMM|nr:putative T6SS immunity periplasmic lipoprotein [Izhakiella australiensis]OON38658.1 hypothetical protein BTJ39_17540 [Izhakiella australiensis]